MNYPHGQGSGFANDVNDSGQIVGEYNNANSSYELSGGGYTPIAVPFAGALATFAYGINDADEIVGGWWDSNRDEHGFTLIGGTYTSFDYPGSEVSAAFGINSAGDIVGGYYDANGIPHAFLLSGGTYTSFDFPGAVYHGRLRNQRLRRHRWAVLHNRQCISDITMGAQGFLLSQGVFTTIAIPGETFTYATGYQQQGRGGRGVRGCRWARCLVHGDAVDGAPLKSKTPNFPGNKQGAFYDEANFEELRTSAKSVGTGADPVHQLGAGWTRV